MDRLLAEPPAPRSPAIPLTAAAVLGAVVDRYADVDAGVWLAFSLFGLLATGIALRLDRDRSAICLGLGVILAAAGLWHHLHWSTAEPDEIAARAAGGRTLVRVRGTIVDAPWQREYERPGQGKAFRTMATLACDERAGAAGWEPVSGRVRFIIREARLDLLIGERVEVLGWLELIEPPHNPGEFDLVDLYRGRRIYASLTTERPESVERIGLRTGWNWAWQRWRASARQRAVAGLAAAVGAERLDVSTTMLIGGRGQLSTEQREIFAKSGTLHVLAVSGMNIGLLALGVWGLVRLAGGSIRLALLAILTVVLGFCWLAETDPPVFRATVIALLWIFARLSGRLIGPGQLTAWAVLALVVADPVQLFQLGAWLSFLAVSVMGLTLRWLTEWRQLRAEAGSRPARRGDDFRGWCAWAREKMVDAAVVTAAIWLMTTPLLVQHTSLMTPAALPLNILLTPLFAVMMWAGYATLALGLIAPVLAWPTGTVFDGLLTAFLAASEGASNLSWGHLYLAALPVWWTLGFYGLWVAVLTVNRSRPRLRTATFAVAGWLLVGAGVAVASGPDRRFHLTMFSVGHGLSVLIEGPAGEALLYDAGSLGDGGWAARAIRQGLWTRGVFRLDGLFISHADADHCNCLPLLVRDVDVRRLYIHRSVIQLDQPVVAGALEAVAAQGIRPTLIAAGTEMKLSPGIRLTVLHPGWNDRAPDDNANSLVILVEAYGRRILLTGDLEKEGLESLLAEPPRDVDVLLAPHHGGRRSNSADLARWASPEYVLSSQSDSDTTAALEETYADRAEIYPSSRVGAVTCTVDASGRLDLKTWKGKTLFERLRRDGSAP